MAAEKNVILLRGKRIIINEFFGDKILFILIIFKIRRHRIRMSLHKIHLIHFKFLGDYSKQFSFFFPGLLWRGCKLNKLELDSCTGQLRIMLLFRSGLYGMV